MKERTPYQDKIIKRYYDNRDDIMRQKLAEMTTDLYLAEGKKRAGLWKRVATALSNLGVSREQVDLLVASDNPAKLAQYLERGVP